jgi:O-methyltransferase involved in polyketide biosynthesis
MSRWNRVSPTAHYTAQVWHVAGLPWADRFDTRIGRWMHRLSAPSRRLGSVIGMPVLNDVLLQRHRLIDHLLRSREVVQLLELAAGLSPRLAAFCAAGGHGVDVDLPPMIALKRKLLAPLPARYAAVALDLLACDDYFAALGEHLSCDAGKTMVVTEGLLPYFGQAQRQMLLERIARLLRAVGGGFYATDLHHVDKSAWQGLAGRMATGFLSRFAGVDRIQFIEGEEQGREIFGNAGFAPVEVVYPAKLADELELPRVEGALAIYVGHIG